jgi:hypothetical protein
MSYSNGSVGVCECGQLAVGNCRRCDRTICEVHAAELPAAPTGVSDDALGRFILAIRCVDGPHCQACRAEAGRNALLHASNAPRATLPNHWLDRAIALSSDHTRSEAEKLQDGQLPDTLTPGQVADEFLRRIGKQPRESVPVSTPSMLRAPDYVEGWTVNCRRTEYIPPGTDPTRHPLPCLISVHGELLGPSLEDGDRQGATWWVVPDSDIELPRLVTGVAHILVMSAFVNDAPEAL